MSGLIWQIGSDNGSTARSSANSGVPLNPSGFLSLADSMSFSPDEVAVGVAVRAAFPFRTESLQKAHWISETVKFRKISQRVREPVSRQKIRYPSPPPPGFSSCQYLKLNQTRMKKINRWIEIRKKKPKAGVRDDIAAMNERVKICRRHVTNWSIRWKKNKNATKAKLLINHSWRIRVPFFRYRWKIPLVFNPPSRAGENKSVNKKIDMADRMDMIYLDK